MSIAATCWAWSQLKEASDDTDALLLLALADLYTPYHDNFWEEYEMEFLSDKLWIDHIFLWESLKSLANSGLIDVQISASEEEFLCRLKMYESEYSQLPLQTENGSTKIQNIIQSPKDTQGWLYIISDGTNFKIGVSKNDVKKRLKNLQTSNANELEIVFEIYTDKYKDLEKHLHASFESFQIRGEWFSLGTSEIKKVKSICEEWEAAYR